MKGDAMNAVARARLRRVLVVDGDRDFADNLRDILAVEGYEVALAHGAAAAKRALGGFAAEVALIDAGLGRGRGIDLIARLRRRHPNLLCVMMIAPASTDASADAAAEALAGGAYDCLRKPFQPVELFAALERCSARLELTQVKAAAEEALRRRHEEQEEQARIYKDVPVGLCELDTSLRYTHINDWLAAINGMSAEDHLGRTIGEVLPDVAQGVESQLRHAIETGEPIIGGAVHAETPAEPGVRRTFQHNYYPIRSGDGTVLGVSCMVEDITERERAKEALRDAHDELESRVEERTAELHEANEGLRRSEEQLRLITDNLPVRIAYIDPQHRYRFVNKGCESWFGRAQADIVGRTIGEILGKPAYEKLRPRIEAVLSGRDVIFDETLEYPDGATRDVRVTYVPHIGQGGGVQGFFALALDITERKRAEDALRESEAWLKSIADHSPALICLKDIEGRYLFVNERFEWLHNVTNEGVRGKTAHEIFPKEIAGPFVDHDRDVIETGEVIEREQQILTRDGIGTFMEIKFPVLDSAGAAVAIGMICTDITERKRSEEALQESEALFKVFINNLPSEIFIRDLDGRFILVNRAWERAQGLTSEEAMGLTVLDIFPQDRADAYAAQDKLVVETEEMLEGELEFSSQDGTKALHTVKFPIRDSKGRVTAVGGFALDITERKRAEDALRESEARLRSLLDHSPALISIKDTEGRYLLANRQHQSLIGKTFAEYKGKTPYDLFPREHAEEVDAHHREVVRTRKAIVYEETLHLNDRVYVSLTTKFPILNPAGEVVNVGSITADITERKRAEEALRESEVRLQSLLEHSPSLISIKDTEGRYLLVNRQHERNTGMTFAEYKGKTPYDLYPREHAEEIDAHLREVVRARKASFRELTLQIDDTVHIFLMSKFPILNSAGEVVDVGSIATDITERKRAEEQLSARARQHAALAKLSHDALVATSLAELFDDAVALVAHTLDVEFAKVLELLPDAKTLALRAGVGWQAGCVGAATVPAERRSQAGYTLVSDAPVVVEDLGAETRFAAPEILRDHNVVSGMSVVIEGQHEPFGVLGAHSTQRRRFSRDEVNVLQAVANILGAAIQREQAGEALRESEEQLRLVTDNLPVLIAYLDSDRRYKFINETCERWYGCQCADIVGRLVSEIHVESEYEKCSPRIEDVLSGKEVTFEQVVTYPDGVMRNIHVTYVPHIDQGGSVRGFFSLSQDITERKRAEDALRESETHVRAVMENIFDSVVTIDQAGRIESFNAAAERAFGYAASEIAGRNVAMLMTEPDRARHDGYIGRFLDTGKGKILGVGPREVTGRRKDGSSFPLEIAITETIIGDKRMFIGAMRDISQRKRAKEALKVSEEMFSKVFQASPGLFVISKPEDGAHYDVNEMWIKVLGHSREEALAHSALELNIWSDPRVRARFVDRLMKERTVRGFEAKFRTKAGEELDFLVSGEYLEVGGEPRMLVVSQDVTERKEMEERLRHAHKMEAVGQLTGGLAHDFNNLLAIVTGNLELLNERLDGDARRRDLVRRAITAAQHGADLTQRLLAFSRKQTLQPRVTDLNELVRETEQLLRGTIGENIEIETVLAGRLWPTLVDPGQLENALLNLVVNARDAMPDGGKLTIETANRRLGKAHAADGDGPRPGQYVMLTVSDTGAGMPPEVVKRAFDPFFTTKELGRGSGLGLSMVYGFIKQSGGHVEIDSKPGRGTTVKAYLPRAGKERIDAAPEPSAAPEPPAGGGEAILVVEDDVDVRDLAVGLLSRLGYRPIEAADGKSALAALGETAEVALLFADVALAGGMSGVELAREARRRRPDLKVLLTSGYSADVIAAQEGLDEGVELIGKPYRKASLARKIGAVLNRKGA